MADRKRYSVRHGRRYGAAKEYGPGDFVWLTDAEYAGVEDMLEPAPEAAPAPPPPPEAPAKRNDGLDKLTVDDLREMAKNLELTGYSSLNKADLIAAIEEAAKGNG